MLNDLIDREAIVVIYEAYLEVYEEQAAMTELATECLDALPAKDANFVADTSSVLVAADSSAVLVAADTSAVLVAADTSVVKTESVAEDEAEKLAEAACERVLQMLLGAADPVEQAANSAVHYV